MNTGIPYIVEGEILDIAEYANSAKERIVKYECLVTMPNGSRITLTNVVEATFFGGISDYFQRRARASKDGSVYNPLSTTGVSANNSIGDRCYISFIGGNILKPVIIGWSQHPAQLSEFATDSAKSDTKAVLQYLGLRIEVDADGQFKIIHKGAPKVEFVPNPLGNVLPSIPGLDKVIGPLSPSVIPASLNELSTIEMLKDGVIKIRDADGQIIEINRDQKKILLSNNNFKTIEPIDIKGSLPDRALALVADFIKIDDGEKGVTISSRNSTKILAQKNREDETLSNYDNKVLKNLSVTVGGDSKEQIVGKKDLQVGGDMSFKIVGKVDNKFLAGVNTTVVGDVKEKISGGWEVITAGDIKLTAKGASLKLSNAKVALGSPAAELLDLIDQLITQILLATYGTGVGPSSPMTPPASTQIATIQSKLNLIKGSL